MGKKNKYSKGDVLIEILRSRKTNIYTFPLAKKIEIFCEFEIDQNLCKKGLLMYTVINKGEWLSLMFQNKVVKVYIINLLPKNKCIVKNSAFEVVFYNKIGRTAESEDLEVDAKPMIESLALSFNNRKNHKQRSLDLYTPWEHRIQPTSLQEGHIDLIPWDKGDTIKNEMTTQTLPDISLFTPKPKNNDNKERKILTLAFPQINAPDRRPVTSLEIEIKYKSVNNSPVARNSFGHKNSVY